MLELREMERQGRRGDLERFADLARGKPLRALLHEAAEERQTGFLGEGRETFERGFGFHSSKNIEGWRLCQEAAFQRLRSATPSGESVRRESRLAGHPGPAGYHFAPLLRFLALAAPLLLVSLALGTLALDAAGLAPDLGPLAARGVARPEGLPGAILFASWGLEALALLALFLLVWGRTPRWWLDGIAVGASAWTFRGPLLVLAVAGMTRLPVAPFWQLARGALILDLVAALALAALARATLGDER